MYNKFLPDTFVKSFKLRKDKTIEIGLRVARGCEVSVDGLTINDVHPVVTNSGLVEESSNGLIKYKFNTDNTALKDVVLVYEGGWFIDVLESESFVTSNFQSTPSLTVEWMNGYDRKEPSYMF